MAIVDNLPRCEKHGNLLIRGKDECIRCVRERMDSPEEKAKTEAFFARVADVITFGDKLKRRMQSLQKQSVRIACPEHPDKFITAHLAGPRNHLHFACEVEGCRYWMME